MYSSKLFDPCYCGLLNNVISCLIEDIPRVGDVATYEYRIADMSKQCDIFDA